MKRLLLLSLSIFTAVSITACGAAQGTPTLSGEQVQSTAVAAAYTAVAQTQAAMPTATPLPPTETPTETPTATPLSTDTPAAPPALEATFTSVPQTNIDPCSTRVLSWSPKGRETTIQIVNTVKAQVTVSLYLNETASWGECGYRSYVLGPRDNVVITDLVQGCYNLWAFNNDQKNPVNASGYGCINNPDKWTFEISAGNIKFGGP